LFAATTWRLAALFATGRAATLRDTGVARTTVLNPGSSTERSEELDGQRRVRRKRRGNRSTSAWRLTLEG
jgi:hypothetical protein